MFRSVNSFLNMIFKSSQGAKSGFEVKTRRYKKDFTPSYVFMLKDLDSKEQQIFEATVYYLCTIAALKKEYQNDIIEVLNKALLKNKKHEDRAAYIQKMMEEKKLI